MNLFKKFTWQTRDCYIKLNEQNIEKIKLYEIFKMKLINSCSVNVR